MTNTNLPQGPGWHFSVRAVSHTCALCGHSERLKVAVFRCCDPGGPQWLIGWACSKCGRDSLDAATEDQVAAWARTIGPWQRAA